MYCTICENVMTSLCLWAFGEPGTSIIVRRQNTEQRAGEGRSDKEIGGRTRERNRVRDAVRERQIKRGRE